MEGICFHQLSWQIQCDRKEIWNLTFRAQFIRAKEWWAVCGITRTIDLIHDTRHLCTRSKIDGIKAMSRGISGGKQVIKFTNTSNRGRVCLFYQTRRRFHSHAKCIHRVLARFTPLLFTMRTSTVATAYNKVTMITSTHILTLSSLRWNGLHFLLSRINKLNRDFFYCQCFSLVCSPEKATISSAALTGHRE